MNNGSTSAPMVTVLSGRTCIGFILNRGRDGVEAYAAAGEQSLGLYRDQLEAIGAISEKIAAAKPGRSAPHSI